MGKRIIRPRAGGKVLVLALVVMLLAVAAIAAPAAFALPSFTTGSGVTPACSTCHGSSGPGSTGDQIHALAAHSAIGCATCHTAGSSTPPTTGACGGCHGGVAHIVTEPTHSTQGCTVAGCHAVPDQVSKVTIKVSGLSAGAIKLGKSVTASGVVTPVHAGKVTITFQRKVGTKWVKMKAVARTSNATTGAYSFKYKPTKKGSWRVQSVLAAAPGFTKAQTAWKTFKVK
jgi:hypothetical protein